MALPSVTNLPPSRWVTFDFSKISSLLAKTDNIFWLCVTALAASLAMRLYNAHQKHRDDVNLYSLWNDEQKLAKSLLFLSQSIPALEKCDNLLGTVKDTPAKQQILFKLALQYAKTRPERAIQIASTLPSIHQLLEVAQEIPVYCEELNKAYSDFGNEKTEPTLDRVECALKFETIFGRLKQENLRTLANVSAQQFTKILENKLDQVRAWCALAMNVNQPPYPATIKHYMMKASALCTSDILPPADLIKAHMALAETYFSVGNYQAMETALETTAQLSATTGTVPIAEQLAKLLVKIQTTKDLRSPFLQKLQDMSVDQLSNVPDDPSLPPQKLMEKRLAMAEIKYSVHHMLATWTLADQALQYLRTLPKSRDGMECRQQANALKRLATLYHEHDLETTLKVIKALEDLYQQWPSDDKNGKSELGRSILSFYNSKNLPQPSEAFFQSCLALYTTEELIAWLTIHENCLTPAQKQSFQDSAKRLIPEPSHDRKSPAITNAPWVAGAALVGYIFYKIFK